MVVKQIDCTNCQGNWSDYYGEGYPCDQCHFGKQELSCGCRGEMMTELRCGTCGQLDSEPFIEKYDKLLTFVRMIASDYFDPHLICGHAKNVMKEIGEEL